MANKRESTSGGGCRRAHRMVPSRKWTKSRRLLQSVFETDTISKRSSQDKTNRRARRMVPASGRNLVGSYNQGSKETQSVRDRDNPRSDGPYCGRDVSHGNMHETQTALNCAAQRAIIHHPRITWHTCASSVLVKSIIRCSRQGVSQETGCKVFEAF